MINKAGFRWNLSVESGKLYVTIGGCSYEFTRDEAVFFYLDLANKLSKLKKK